MDQLRSQIYRILRWSERYTKTDMTYVASGGFWLTLGQGVGAISGLLISIAFANLVSPETFGIYKYVLSVAGIIGAFSLTGMSTAVTQAVARGFEGALRQGFSTSLKWGLLMTAIAWSGALYYGIQDNYTLALSLLIVGIFQPLLNSSNLFGSFLTGKKAFRQSTTYLAAKTLFTTVALLITIYLTDNPIVIVLAYFVFNTAPAVVQYFYILQTYKPNKEIDEKTVNYSKHLSAMEGLNRIATHVDMIIVFHFLGAANLAIYTFAKTIPDHLKQLLNLTPLMVPRFTQHSISNIKKTVWRKIFFLTASTLFVILVYILLAPFIFNLLFPEYNESIYYSQLYSVSLLAISTAIPKSVFIAHRKVGVLYALSNIMPVVRILLLVFFAYLYGIWGVIISIMIARFFALILNIALMSTVKK